MAEQFIKVANDKIKRKPPVKFLNQLGLYMLIQAFLSNPSLTTVNGGFKKAVMKHCSNGKYSFNNSWNDLKDMGLLKRSRMPVSNNRFYDYYQLLDLPDEDIPAVRNFTAKQGQAFIASKPERFVDVNIDYTAISYKAIMDSSLSLSAKGLFAVIQRLILISQRTDLVITKTKIREACKEGTFKFDTLWRELKEKGYLVMQQGYDKQAKKTQYTYTLSGSPAPTKTKGGNITTLSKITETVKTERPAANYDREALKREVHYIIDYPTLEDWAENRSDAYYEKKDINRAVEAIVDTLCLDCEIIKLNKGNVPLSKLKSVLMENLTTEVVHEVLNRVVITPPKFNANKYILAALYNECIINA